MCGIVGYIGNGLAIPVVLDSLKKLEYRGYDSSGIAFLEGQNLYRERRAGKLEVLQKALANRLISSGCAIGHTRWATHGIPNIYNSHPHTDMTNTVAVVHNGIIENYQKLKNELSKKDVVFSSQTDTEVIPQLIYQEIKDKKFTVKNILKAIISVNQKIKGTFALAILVKGVDCVFATKRGSPLIVGHTKNANYIASDIPAILSYTNQILQIKDNETAVLNTETIKVYDKNLKITKPKFEKVNVELDDIMLGNYENFMQKEIAEGAKSVIETITRLDKFDIIGKLDKTKFKDDFNIHITACGTALHAGHIAKYLMEKYLEIPVDLDFASEFRYKNPLLNEKSICIFISQSGETADTLACLDLAKSKGAYTLGITNVVSSKMAQEVDLNIPTSAGMELAVASTKAYLAQLSAIYFLVVKFGEILKKPVNLDLNKILRIVDDTKNVNYIDTWKELLPTLARENSMIFIGRGLDYFLAMEGALKVKEISYIHCEAMPAGELKHGSLALITPLSYVVVILTQKSLCEKTINAVHELKSRGAKVILITNLDIDLECDKIVKVPNIEEEYSPFVTIRSLQELAYLLAKFKGVDPDKPRNLAKSVTVE